MMNETLTMSAEKSLWSGGGAVASPVQQGEVSWVFPVYPYSREGEGRSAFLDGSCRSQLWVSHAPAAPFQLRS